MKKKKTARNPIIKICACIVETHEDRKRSIRNMKAELASLRSKTPGLTISDMPRSTTNKINNPVAELNIRIEELENYIAEEQRRVDIVESAMGKIGLYEPDLELRNKIKTAIIDNIMMGGYYAPYEYVDYPKKYSKDAFYAQRKAFLMDIAKDLCLILKA